MKAVADYEQRIQCLIGTFAVENMSIAPHVIAAIKQLDSGEVDYRQLVAAAKQSYTTKN